MAHGSGPRAVRPHQAAREAGRTRRRVLTYAQGVRVRFEDGKATVSDVKDAEKWAAYADRQAHRLA